VPFQINFSIKIERLHGQGFDLESTDCFGFTPLMCAAAEGNLHVVKFLLSLNVNSSTKK
jgi:ankyrin repeat protein